MTGSIGPTIEQWQDLRTIVYQVEAIVSDPPELPDFEVTGGLLQWPPGSIELDRAKTRLRRLNRHTTLLTGIAPVSKECSVLEILPGIDRLGDSRQDRIGGLLRSLLSLPAYKWLHDQLAYRECLKTLKFLGKTKPAYSVDTREFLLLRALTYPIQLLQLQRERKLTPMYPTTAELVKAHRQLRDFTRFLSERSAISEVLDLDYRLRLDLEKTEVKLKSALVTYRKPRDDGTLRERHFLDFLISSLSATFGNCSLALVENISAIVDVSFDRSDVQARIRRHKNKPPGRDISRLS